MKKIVFYIGMLGVVVSISMTSSTALAFTDNFGVPTSGNTPNPINVGSTFQTKQGSFQSNSDLRAPMFFDSQNTDYYLDPAGTSRLGNIIQRNSSPTLYLQDTDHRSAMIHVNTNQFYVLRGCGNDSTLWCATPDPLGTNRWPLTINLETNDAAFGRNVEVHDLYLRSIGRWASQLEVNPYVGGFGLTVKNDGRIYRRQMVEFNGRNYCSLNRVTGRYEGGGERAEVWIEDGWWWLGGHSLQDSWYITGYCLVL